MPPVFSMFCSIAKFKAIWFQIARLFGALQHISPLYSLSLFHLLIVLLARDRHLIVHLAPPPKLGLELLVRLSLSCQAAFQGLQQNYISLSQKDCSSIQAAFQGLQQQKSPFQTYIKTKEILFLATLVALHFTPVSEWVGGWVVVSD